ncbi:MAG TPA: molybdopterin-dependent oxidoreductase [Nitrososphaeraceae archaeon]|nr:molybdopterin-dependent oxidoreductase [Nitrososphaeraceae archaeon]
MVLQISLKLLFLGGVVAGAIAVSVGIILRLLAGGLFMPEVASLTLFSLTPGEVESQAVQTLGPLAKYSSFIGATLVSIVIHGLIGILVGRLYDRFRWKRYLGKAVQTFAIAYLILLAITSVLLALTEASTVSFSDVILFLIPPNVAFGLVFPALYQKVSFGMPSISKKTTYKEQLPSDGGTKARTVATDGKKMNRRIFLRSAVASAIAVPVLYYGTSRLLFTTQEQPVQPVSPVLPASQPSSAPPIFQNRVISPLLQYEVTPTELFYRIDINPIIPTVNSGTWRLNIKGLVENPIELTYEELKAMPPVEQSTTLSCISNKVGGDLISNALWRGVPLKNLLEQAQIRPGAEYIVFKCYDGYDVGIPLEKGLEDSTILAYEMNRAPLTPAHGFPVRAIVPNIYGMMNAKWITEIEIIDHVYEGFWQRKGWSNTARINTLSTIVIPGSAPLRTRFRGFLPAASTSATSNSTLSNASSSSSPPERTATLGGIAFAGSRGISKVQISIDDGNTWTDASIKEPLSQYSWVIWAADLSLPSQPRNDYKVSVRATDKAGNVQTSEVREPFPDGSTGYHMIDIQA